MNYQTFLKSEVELREIWSNPITRKTLLEKLSEAGFGLDELNTLKNLIDAEKSDLFDVLEYVFKTDNKNRMSCSNRSYNLCITQQQEKGLY